MTHFYDLDEANRRLPDIRDLLERLLDQRRQLVSLRDRAAERLATVGTAGEPLELAEERVGDDAELRAIRLRMQGVIDQMQAAVSQLDTWEVVLRDIPTGLVDLPALANGRQVWLCWRLGEERIEWWHELEAGVAGRRPLIELT